MRAGWPAANSVGLLMRNLMLLALASLTLAACATTGKPSPGVGPTAPTVPPALCPATIKAPSLAEPVPPEIGLTEAVLYDMVVTAVGEDRAKAWWAWFTTTHPDWGREGWRRIDAARAAPLCR